MESKRNKPMDMKLTKRQLASPTRGWRHQRPKSINQRRALLQKCGERCFLMPETLKFPICSEKKCKVSCKGVVSAKVRAGQWKYDDVYEKASQLIEQLKCTKKSREMRGGKDSDKNDDDKKKDDMKRCKDMPKKKCDKMGGDKKKCKPNCH